MAMHPLRLRRTLTTLVTLNRTALSSVSNPTIPPAITGVSSSARTATPSPVLFQSRWFRSSPGLLSSKRQYKLYKEGDEITEDTVLFEGCDYNHWLITVDFPRDDKPPPEEMVRTYERICAQGLGISVEEAKKRIYACSTTTYEGFQAVMTEQESEKFNGVPGVVFVLPDSYIDPVNKEYGGDKYDNGIITPRPPPIQYGRKQGGRTRQTNRSDDGPTFYDSKGFPVDRQGNPQHPPRQNYAPQSPMNNREYAPRGPDPSYQGGNYAPRQSGNYGQWTNPGANSGTNPASGYGQSYEQRSNTASGQHSYSGYGQSYGQGSNYPASGQNSNSGYGQSSGQGSNYPASGQNSNPGYGQSYGQGSNYPASGQNANSVYGPSYGQGSNYPSSGQNYGYGPGATPSSGQRANAGYAQTNPGHGADQGFSQAGQPAQPAGPMGQGGMQQGRY